MLRLSRSGLAPFSKHNILLLGSHAPASQNCSDTVTASDHIRVPGVREALSPRRVRSVNQLISYFFIVALVIQESLANASVKRATALRV